MDTIFIAMIGIIIIQIGFWNIVKFKIKSLEEGYAYLKDKITKLESEH
ncbi:MAG: hypothetical protein ACLTDM_11135 [Clostridium butyricum]